MNKESFEDKTSEILSVIGHPFRIKILLTIGKGEACVCHLEARLKKRQAFISQHLMALRNAGILETRREGKYIFYRLVDPDAYTLIQMAGKLAGWDQAHIPEFSGSGTSTECCCPKCTGEQ